MKGGAGDVGWVRDEGVDVGDGVAGAVSEMNMTEVVGSDNDANYNGSSWTFYHTEFHVE